MVSCPSPNLPNVMLKSSKLSEVTSSIIRAQPMISVILRTLVVEQNWMPLQQMFKLEQRVATTLQFKTLVLSLVALLATFTLLSSVLALGTIDWLDSTRKRAKSVAYSVFKCNLSWRRTVNSPWEVFISGLQSLPKRRVSIQSKLSLSIWHTLLNVYRHSMMMGVWTDNGFSPSLRSDCWLGCS